MKIIKYLATFILHPIVSFYLFSHGVKRFVILPQMTVNKLKYIDIGNDFYLGRNSRFLLIDNYKGAEYKCSVKIGKNVSIGNRFSALSASPIIIGDDSLIASDVFITSENHGMNPETKINYADNALSAAPVTIGKGCWIGEKSIILPGVELGDRCIVAAGSVVTKSFQEYTLIGGIPAKAIKRYDMILHEWIKC